MRDSQLAGDIARSDAIVGQLDNPLADEIRQWPPVHEHSSKLIYSTVTCTG